MFLIVQKTDEKDEVKDEKIKKPSVKVCINYLKIMQCVQLFTK